MSSCRAAAVKMYSGYFGFSDTPFSIAPDPRFLYLSGYHREALAHLLYGVHQGGFVVLTGEVGTGKTTVCRCLLQQLPSHVDVAFIINPRQSVSELLQSILAELGIDLDGEVTSTKLLVDLLNERLLESHALGRNTILIIDEAQNLSPEVLEQLRLLTNLETNERKLLQLILLGQPELNNLLDSQQLRQLAQRVTARYHLSALSSADVREYVIHRLAVAGFRGELFTRAALRRVNRLSRGIPRLINLICDRALLGVYSSGGQRVDRRVVGQAAAEVLPPAPNRYRLGLAAMLIVGIGLLGWLYMQQRSAGDLEPDLTTTETTALVGPPAADPLPVGADPIATANPTDTGTDVDGSSATPPRPVGSTPVSEPTATPDSTFERSETGTPAVSIETEALPDTAGDLDIALSALGRLWNLATAVQPVCPGQPVPGLWCQLYEGAPGPLYDTGLPAVLRLTDWEGRYALLTHRPDGGVELAPIGPGASTGTSPAPTRLSRAELDSAWPGKAWVITPLNPALQRQLPVGPGERIPAGFDRLVADLPVRAGALHYPGYRRTVIEQQNPSPGLVGALFERFEAINRDGPSDQLTPTHSKLLRNYQRRHGLAPSGELDQATVVHLFTSTMNRPQGDRIGRH